VLAQANRDLYFSQVDDTGLRGTAHAVVDPGAAADLLHDRGIRHEKRVVLILAGGRLSFHGEHADDEARLVFHAHRLANRIGIAEQLIDDRLAEDAHAVRPLDVRVGEDAATYDVPALDGHVRGR